MEVNGLKLRNEICCTRKFCDRLEIIAKEKIKLMKKVQKDKCFGVATIFKWHVDFKKEGCQKNWHLSLTNQKKLQMIDMLTLCRQSCEKANDM